MKIYARVSIILILGLLGFMAVGPLRPSRGAAKPAVTSCGSKTVTVFTDGLHGGDNEVFVCNGDTVSWEMNTQGRLKGFIVHFDESPFNPDFERADYCAGADCPGHATSTEAMPVHTKTSNPNYIRRHKYVLTIMPTDSPQFQIDPYVIVGTASSAP